MGHWGESVAWVPGGLFMAVARLQPTVKQQQQQPLLPSCDLQCRPSDLFYLHVPSGPAARLM
jgi:hypothetical protein